MRYTVGKFDYVIDDGDVMTTSMIVDRLNRLYDERNRAYERAESEVIKRINIQAAVESLRRELAEAKRTGWVSVDDARLLINQIAQAAGDDWPYPELDMGGPFLDAFSRLKEIAEDLEPPE